MVEAEGNEKRHLETVLRQQESLRAVIEAISSELELRPLLTRIVRHACELLGAEHGTIGLADPRRNLIRTEAAYRMPDSELGMEMPPGVGLAGRVLQTRQPIILNRYAEVAAPLQPDLLEDAVIAVPIFWHGRMTGFFGLGSAPPKRFTGQDLELLSLFARHAAIAIENARRYEDEQKRAQRLAVIARICQNVTADLPLDRLLQSTADAIHELLGYPNVAIPLIDPDAPETLVLRTVGGFYKSLVTQEYRLPVSGGVMGAAAREQQVQMVNDVDSDPRFIPTPGAQGIRAELAAPILLRDRTLGVVNVESSEPFTGEDAASLQIIADQLAVAIENSRLYARAQGALREMQRLYETSRRISTAMEVGDVIAAYLAQVAAEGQYACSVALYEFNEFGERTTVVVRGRWSPQEGMSQEEQRFAYALDALDPPLDAGQTVTIEDVETDARVSEELRRIQRRSRRPALALVPLMVRGNRIGLVILSSPKAHPWSDDDLHPYQATAAQLATALDSRAQHLLLAERGQELAVLEERQRLARELHDSVTQLIFSMTLIAQSISPAMQRDPQEGEHRIQRLLELSQMALAEMRALLAELRPSGSQPVTPELKDALRARPLPAIFRVRQEGLVQAFRHHAAEMLREGLKVTLEAKAYTPQETSVEEALFRIAQEALNNVVKHACARQAALQLSAAEEKICLTIRDDGIGFAVESPGEGRSPRSGGLGLATMRERAESLGGSLSIQSAPGSGATLTVTIPMKE